MHKYFFILAFLTFLGACTQAPDFPKEPVISNIQINKTILKQGLGDQDSLLVSFDFTDGDGDVGREDSLSITFIDNRDDSVSDQFSIPFVPEAGSGNGIEGTIYVRMKTTCCIFASGQPPCNPSTSEPTNIVSFTVFIKDRSGNESNRLRTPDITLLCE